MTYSLRQVLPRAANTVATTLGLALILAACGGGQDEAVGSAAPANSSGQVAAGGGTFKVSHYAASRFAEQTSFGPTPALVQEIRNKGFEKWIDDQFALPVTSFDAKSVEYYTLDGMAANPLWEHWRTEQQRLWLVAPDQLRLRVNWSLSQFIVTSTRKIDVAGGAHWFNLLQGAAFGSYGDLLYKLSISPAMGVYLDNNQNRPKSQECPHCAPNENFARELMQLFALGVLKLNPDGTPMRNSRGGFIETYSQTDVEQLARVLTGWQFNPEPQNRPGRNWPNWGKPMVPSTWPPERDSGEKRVLGKVFPAGQTADQDLRDTVSLLMGHQNIAPFVSLRLIQHLVKSNPTPAYVSRVAAVFRSNGSGAAGDMKAVLKAVLLDSEARVGDDPTKSRSDDGKLREPALHRMAVLRGLGCQKPLLYSWGGVSTPATQQPYAADSVFSYYAPTDRAPGSNVLAPEQKLITASEFTMRFGELAGFRWNNTTKSNDMSAFVAAGCSTDPLTKAFAASSKTFSDHLSERWFRGAMPPTLRSNIDQLIRKPTWDTRSPDEGALRMLSYALATPYYGVIK